MSRLKLYRALARVMDNDRSRNPRIVYNAYVAATSKKEASKGLPTLKQLKRDYAKFGYDLFERWADEITVRNAKITVTSLDNKVK